MSRVITCLVVLLATRVVAVTSIGSECGGTVTSQQMNPSRQHCYDNARYGSTPMMARVNRAFSWHRGSRLASANLTRFSAFSSAPNAPSSEGFFNGVKNG